jgi:hypothetical protein
MASRNKQKSKFTVEELNQKANDIENTVKLLTKGRAEALFTAAVFDGQVKVMDGKISFADYDVELFAALLVLAGRKHVNLSTRPKSPGS